MKSIIKVLLLMVIISSSLFAKYYYNISPINSGIVEVYKYEKVNNKLKFISKKKVNEDNVIKLSIKYNTNNGDIYFNATSKDKKLKKYLVVLYNNQKLGSKLFSNNYSIVKLVLQENKIKMGTYKYKALVLIDSSKYAYSLYFKDIIITKSYKPSFLGVTAVSESDTAHTNNPIGYVGEKFTFSTSLREPLPAGYIVCTCF